MEGARGDLMPKYSGYPQARDRILTHIAENNPKELDRGFTASLLQVSISTAGNYLSILANEYPNSLKYIRGTLLVLSVLPDKSLPPNVKMELKNRKIETIKKSMETLEKNHLRHNDKKKILEEVKRIRKELDQL